jgi:hypothetical protein
MVKLKFIFTCFNFKKLLKRSSLPGPFIFNLNQMFVIDEKIFALAMKSLSSNCNRKKGKSRQRKSCLNNSSPICPSSSLLSCLWQSSHLRYPTVLFELLGSENCFLWSRNETGTVKKTTVPQHW